MSKIRPFRIDDIAAVATLKAAVFNWRRRDSSAQREDRIRRFVVETPFNDPAFPSLVAEDANGRLRGFVGVSTRAIQWQGESLRGVVSSHLMVDPANRGMAGVELLQAVLSGDQDLTFADSANASAKRLWNGLGGMTPLQDALEWIIPVRPVRWVTGLTTGRYAKAYRLLARPVVSVADAIGRVLAPAAQNQPLDEEPMTPDGLVQALRTTVQRDLLVHVPAESQIGWLLDEIRRGPDGETLRATLLRDSSGNVVGWHVRFAARSGTCRVVQIGATPRFAADVVAHLVGRARAEGAASVRGRLSVWMADILARAGAFLTADAPIVMFASKRQDVRDALARGQANLSRLDGEWWMIHLS